MPAQLQLSIAALGATDDEIADMTRELATWLGDAAVGCEITQPTAPGPEGGKGLFEILGSLGVHFLDGGALKSLLECLAVYIKERRREVSITLKTSSGGSVELKAGGLGARELEDVLWRVSTMLGPEAKAPV